MDEYRLKRRTATSRRAVVRRRTCSCRRWRSTSGLERRRVVVQDRHRIVVELIGISASTSDPWRRAPSVATGTPSDGLPTSTAETNVWNVPTGIAASGTPGIVHRAQRGCLRVVQQRLKAHRLRHHIEGRPEPEWRSRRCHWSRSQRQPSYPRCSGSPDPGTSHQAP